MPKELLAGLFVYGTLGALALWAQYLFIAAAVRRGILTAQKVLDREAQRRPVPPKTAPTVPGAPGQAWLPQHQG
ncbi:hypothetical protein [Actinoplanes rectilineatus]|uniref:hypothetical protein n=1 Tax=Actinoplanes rectilineatus TaxID=113571 RepID=UPI0005F2D9F5|nr:hypothetical protein [Actinoplanes rectilineatus]